MDDTGKLIEQLGELVTDFSSQYGFEGRVAYTMSNIAGGVHVHPQYGDFTDAAVLRTYGTYWRRSKFFPRYRKAELESLTYSDDFVELQFEKKVCPAFLHIYETYNPGTVVRVLALHNEPRPRWHVVWRGEAEQATKEARELVLCLQPVDFLTRTIRIEFNSRFCEYYTEFDAVKLIGRAKAVSLPKSDPSTWDAAERLQQLAITAASGSGDFAHVPDSDNGYFDILPYELMEAIFSYFDIESRFRIARVSKLFQQHALCTFKPTEIDLQPFWHLISDDTLKSFVHYFPTEKYSKSRTSSSRGGLKSVNLSWSGWHPTVFCKPVFSDFLSLCCSSLHTLSLANCRFLDAEALKSITSRCHALEHLDVSSCAESTDAFLCIAELKRLTGLNLYRTKVDGATVHHICTNCDSLRSLNLGSADRISNYDQLISQIAQCSCAAHFQAFDFWRARSLTDAGILTLADKFKNLEELDIGWTQVDGRQQALVQLAKSCIRLRKLFLTAIRTVSTRELAAFAENLRELEQLDILGAYFSSSDDARLALSKLLAQCTNLHLLDVSFCGGLDFQIVYDLRSRFPRVDIKKSYQTEGH